MGSDVSAAFVIDASSAVVDVMVSSVVVVWCGERRSVVDLGGGEGFCGVSPTASCSTRIDY